MVHNIIMPDLGQTVAEGKIVRWLKTPGDKVSRGEPLLEVETDKVTMEVESHQTGYLRKLLVGEGQMAHALSPIAILTDTPEETCDPLRPPGIVSAAAPQHEKLADFGRAPNPQSGSLTAAPSAKALARERGIELSAVSGTGPGGLISRKDVEQFDAARSAKPMMAMASLVTRSVQTIPHFQMTMDVDVAAAERWRENWNAAHPELLATFNDIFVRAASKALRDTPRMNVSFQDGRFESRSGAGILLVAATDAAPTLVPLTDPGTLSWEEFLRSMRKALSKIKEGRATELPGETVPLLAISNLGMFRVKQFVAIIPPKCTAILAVGATRDVPVVVNQQVTLGRVASLTLSVDHRVVDGITAAKFMDKIQEHLNTL